MATLFTYTLPLTPVIQNLHCYTNHSMMHLYLTHVRKTFRGALFYFHITGIYRTDLCDNKPVYRHTCFQGLPQLLRIPIV